jgi:hypothetical protein
MYDAKDQAVAQVDTTLNGHILKVVNQQMFAMRVQAEATKTKPQPLEYGTGG